MSMTPRLNRLLADDGRCFDVAIVHGFFNERTFLDNIEDMKRVVATIIAANPDAVQLSPGLAPILQAWQSQDLGSDMLINKTGGIMRMPLQADTSVMYAINRHQHYPAYFVKSYYGSCFLFDMLL